MCCSVVGWLLCCVVCVFGCVWCVYVYGVCVCVCGVCVCVWCVCVSGVCVGGSRDRYVTMVEWISTTHLSVRWMNRAQNASLLSVCEAAAGSCVQVCVFARAAGEASLRTWPR